MIKGQDKDVYIWLPSDKDMLKEYPDMKKIEEFKGLKDYQLKFCWFYANPTSPLVAKQRDSNGVYTTQDRLEESVGKCLDDKSDTEKAKYIDKKWGDEVSSALKRMQNTKTRDRVIASRLFNMAYTNMEAIIGLPVQTVNEMSMSDKKSYMTLSLDFMKNMDDIIDKREAAYGVKTVDKEGKKDSQVESIDSIIKNLQ